MMAERVKSRKRCNLKVGNWVSENENFFNVKEKKDQYYGKVETVTDAGVWVCWSADETKSLEDPDDLTWNVIRYVWT